MVIHRLNTEDGWDQAIFSECVFSPSRPGHKVGWQREGMQRSPHRPCPLIQASVGDGANPQQRPARSHDNPGNAGPHLFMVPHLQDPSVTRRVMDYENFLNSKTLFKHLRYEGQKYLEHRPYVVHINSHTGATGWAARHGGFACPPHCAGACSFSLQVEEEDPCSALSHQWLGVAGVPYLAVESFCYA